MEYDLAESIQLVSATRSPSLPLLGNGSSSQAHEPDGPEAVGPKASAERYDGASPEGPPLRFWGWLCFPIVLREPSGENNLLRNQS